MGILQTLIAGYTNPGSISFDAQSKGAGVGSQTVSHTISGTNRILFVASICTAGNTTGVTYNGSAMTLITTQSWNAGSGSATLWYIVAPSTGANNIVSTVTGGYVRVMATSYTGAKQTGVPDAFGSAFNNSPVSSFTSVVSTVGSSPWHVCGCVAGVITAGSGTTQRTTAGDSGMFDSNGPVSGTSTLNINTSSSFYVVVGASFLPA